MGWVSERTNSDDDEESTLGWALLPEVMEGAGPEDEGLASVIKEYVAFRRLTRWNWGPIRSEVMIVTTINENGGKGQPNKTAYEAERKRRMAKLRRDSAKRTIEIIERKFPNLKTTTK